MYTMIGFTMIAYKQVLVTFLILQTAVKRCCLSWSANSHIIGERNNGCYEPSKSDIIPSKCGLPPESDIFPGNFSFCLTFNELPVDSKTKVNNSLFYQKNSYVLWLPAASILPRSGFRERAARRASSLLLPFSAHTPPFPSCPVHVWVCVSFPFPPSRAHTCTRRHSHRQETLVCPETLFFFPQPKCLPDLAFSWLDPWAVLMVEVDSTSCSHFSKVNLQSHTIHCV